ncbi:MAG: hypothetical protein IIC67_06005 [Thaumarchaeota archaeon]|nr:hypothetical protein [Nitrososphaerota archaeon]
MSDNKTKVTDSKLTDIICSDLEKNLEFEKSVDTKILAGKEVIIKSEYFNSDTKSIIDQQDKLKVCHSIQDAVERIFSRKWGHARLNDARQENGIKIVFDGEIIDDISDDAEWEQYQKSIPNGEIFSAIEWVTEYHIKRKSIISKLDIIQEITRWLSKIGIDVGKDIAKRTLDNIIAEVFSKPDIHSIVLKIASDMGLNNEEVLLHKTQMQEAGEYIKSKYHMKRFGDLVGEVKFHNGIFYEGNADEKILTESLKLLFQSKNAIRKEVVSYIESSVELFDLDSIDDYVTMIPCLNGVYNVKTGEYKEGFDPDIITFDQMPFNYNNNAKRGKVKEIVEFILQNDRAITNFFDWCSCAFLTYTGLTFMKIFESNAGMGKTTLANYIRCIVGRKSIGEPKYHVLVKDATTRIDMHRKRVLIDSEMSEKTPDELSTFKKWILQEYNTDRSIYGHNVDYRPTPIMMGIANRLFEIPDEVELEAMSDRADIDKLTRRIRGRDDEEVKDIKNIMVKTFEVNPEEGDAELTFLLNNATKIYKEGKVKSRQPIDVVMQMWNRLGNLVRQFTQVRMKKVESGWISNEQAWVTWQDYAIPKNIDIGERNPFLEKFRKIMNLDKPIHRRIPGSTDKFEWGYNGVRLLTEDEIKKIEQKELEEYQR